MTYNSGGFIFFWDLDTYTFTKKSKIISGNLNENCDQDIEKGYIFSIIPGGNIQATNFIDLEKSKIYSPSTKKKLYKHYLLTFFKIIIIIIIIDTEVNEIVGIKYFKEMEILFGWDDN